MTLFCKVYGLFFVPEKEEGMIPKKMNVRVRSTKTETTKAEATLEKDAFKYALKKSVVLFLRALCNPLKLFKLFGLCMVLITMLKGEEISLEHSELAASLWALWALWAVPEVTAFALRIVQTKRNAVNQYLKCRGEQPKYTKVPIYSPSVAPTLGNAISVLISIISMVIFALIYGGVEVLQIVLGDKSYRLVVLSNLAVLYLFKTAVEFYCRMIFGILYHEKIQTVKEKNLEFLKMILFMELIVLCKLLHTTMSFSIIVCDKMSSLLKASKKLTENIGLKVQCSFYQIYDKYKKDEEECEQS